MKQVLVLLLLLVLKNCQCGKVKRFLNDQTNITDQSFQVHVTAGYGVHFDNATPTSPVYQFHERKVKRENESTPQNHQDQMSEPSQLVVNELLPSVSYQVHEMGPEVQEKNFQVSSNPRHRSVEKRARPLNNLESNKHQLGGPKIVEVLRVPAVYELHLQSDPQRLIALNPLVSKFNAMGGSKYQNSRVAQQKYFNGAKSNFQQNQGFGTNNYGGSYNQQTLGNMMHNLKLKLLNQRFNQNHGYNQVKTTTQPPPVNNYYKTGYLRNLNYQPKVNPEGFKKTIQNSAVPNQLDYHQKANPIPAASTQVDYQLNNQISSDYYQKPQALHEVPAPIFNQQTYKPSVPKIQATSVPNLVYGKPLESPYQPKPGLWDNGKLQEQVYSKGQVASVPNYYQQYYQDNLKAEASNTQNYQNHLSYDQTGQSYFNEAIGEHLDQSLANVNGGVSTYLNPDGTMTVSNFHHTPQLYKDPELPPSEPQKFEDLDFDGDGLMGYGNQHADLTNFNNQMYSGYSQEIPVTEDDNDLLQGEQNSADFNFLLDSARASMDDNRFSPMGGYSRGQGIKRVSYPSYPRSFGGSNRRMEQPMDYILYINQRTID